MSVTIPGLRSRLGAAQRAYHEVAGQERALSNLLSDLAARIEKAEADAEAHKKAAAFLTQYSDEREASVHGLIENLVSQGLQHVFEEDLRFVVAQKISGTRTVVEFQIVSDFDGEQIATPVLSARGGGVAAVCGFLLQVVVILLTDAPRVLLLDEAFAQVSADYEERLADFISQLADSLGLQVIMVTHSDAYADHTDASWRVSSHSGATQIERIH